MSLEQSINIFSLFSEEQKNKLSIPSNKINCSHYLYSIKRFQTEIKEHDVNEHIKLNSNQRENHFNDNFLQKCFHQNYHSTLRTRKKLRSHIECKAQKSTFTTNQNCTKAITYKIRNLKLSKLKSASEITVWTSSRKNPRETPLNGSEAENGLVIHDVSEMLFKNMLL